MYFHFHCDDQGFNLLAGLFKKTAIEEMQHVERLADRILFLGGDVNMKSAADVTATSDVKAMLECACAMEQESIKQYNKWAMDCAANADSVSRKLFEDLVADEERHFGQYDNELRNLDKFGKDYLALQSMERSRATSARTSAE